MTKHFARLALVGAAAVSFALPAAPANACVGTFVYQCVQNAVDSIYAGPICPHYDPTLGPVCVG